MADSGDMQSKANQIWKMLDEMAESNPASYRDFIEKKMEEAKTFFQKPAACVCIKVLDAK